MEQGYIEESVKERLILSGMQELQEHGITDFSLRRAALSAQVSCAAPYRHFKDKDAYIAAIIHYVQTQWELLCREIEQLFAADAARLCVELCLAAMRFRIANPRVRSVFALTEHSDAFDAGIIRATTAYAASRGLDVAQARQKTFLARALVAGGMSLVGDGEAPDEALAIAKGILMSEFQ